PECGACAGLCPTETPALRLTRGRPVVDDDACVGCGLCIEACPTSPKALIFEELRP
ncbi:MAG: 4Fe-4S binding protein, partial [Myxococcales bacterium]|nr:4Fe-4S binding protein [Myxococcales bacterium]